MLLMAAYLRSAAPYIATSFGGCVRYFGELARRMAEEQYLRNAIRTLHQFDDHMLTDIGLSRGAIEYAVRNGRPNDHYRFLQASLKDAEAAGTVEKKLSRARTTIAKRNQRKPRHAA